jgi:hypothetical protein
MLAKVPNRKADGTFYNGTFLEWIREDPHAISANNGRFPTAPGVYYVQVAEHDPNMGTGEVYVDPLMDVRKHVPSLIAGTSFTLPHEPVPGSLRIYEMPSSRLLVEGVDYMAMSPTDYEMVDIIPPQLWLSVDYKWADQSRGPFPFTENTGNSSIVPGVTLAFGRNVQKGDAVAVVVYPNRQRAFHIYGGRWSLQAEIEIITTDKLVQMEITDQTSLFIHSILRPKFAIEGTDISSVSLGSPSEEPRDDNGDDYFYNCTISMSMETDWELYVPLEVTLRSFDTGDVTMYSNPYTTGFNPAEGLGLILFQDPFFYTARNSTYPMVR